MQVVIFFTLAPLTPTRKHTVEPLGRRLSFLGPGAILDVMEQGKITSPAGNQNPYVHSIASYNLILNVYK
jgi:hypothetical protein